MEERKCHTLLAGALTKSHIRQNVSYWRRRRTVTLSALRSSSLDNETMRGVWESIEFLYLVLYLNKGSVLRAAWAGTKTHAPQLVWGGWAVWLQLAGWDSAGGRHQRLRSGDFICNDLNVLMPLRNICGIVYEQELLWTAAGIERTKLKSLTGCLPVPCFYLCSKVAAQTDVVKEGMSWVLD